MKVNASHTTLNKLREKNKIFFNNAKFFGDKSYSIDDTNKILTVHGERPNHNNTAMIKTLVKYSFIDNYKLEIVCK